jgi:hypothetical protein
MFTWSPPTFIITYMSDKFLSGLSFSHKDENGSTFTMTEPTKENNISFGHNQASQKYTQDSAIDDLESAKEDVFYSSNVAIVMKL